jgi:hypothetical protein
MQRSDIGSAVEWRPVILNHGAGQLHGAQTARLDYSKYLSCTLSCARQPHRRCTDNYEMTYGETLTDTPSRLQRKVSKMVHRSLNTSTHVDENMAYLCLDLPRGTEALTSIDGARPERLLNTEQLVVLGQALRATGRARLNLAGAEPDTEIGDE